MRSPLSPLWARLLAVVLIPLGGVEWLMWRDAQAQLHRSHEAAAVADGFADLRDVVAAAGAIHTERMLCDAMMAAMAGGSAKAPYDSLGGRTLESALADARSELDARLGALADVSLHSDPAVAAQAGRWATDLVDLRDRLDHGTAHTAESAVFFSEMSDWVSTLTDARLHELEPHSIDGARLHGIVDDAERILGAHQATLDEAARLAVAMSSSPTADVVAAGFAAGIEALDATTLVAESDARFGSEWQAIVDGATAARTRRGTFWTATLDAARQGNALPPAQDPEHADEVHRLIDDTVGELLAVTRLTGSDIDTLAVDADRLAAQARQLGERWVAGLAAVTLGSVVLVLAVARSIVLPIQRLTRHAEGLGRGEVPDTPLLPSGPSDVRTAATAVNRAAYTMRNAALGLERTLHHATRHDVLTGLPNRIETLERIDALVAADSPFGLAIIDVDAFMRLNETWGYGVGDDILRELAGRLRRGVRDGEFVARIGADEFAVLASGIGTPEAMRAIAQRLLLLIGQPIDVAGTLVALSASAGATVSTGGEDAFELFRRCELAVHNASAGGKGRVQIFSFELQDYVEQTADIEHALRAAVHTDELLLHLQPVIELDTGRLWGAEALVRWNRPGHGLVAPSTFIPIAEESDLIVEVDRWVIHQAGLLLREWQRHEATKGLRLSVNVSGRHLVDGDIVADLDTMAAEFGVSLDRLEVELTETALLADLEHGSEVLRAVRARGVRVAVDDFGTGYSSMGYLGELPVDTLKIDRSFVARATSGGRGRSILEVMLNLGEVLGVTVVAEGVESLDQLAFLKASGCERAQGFLFAVPMPQQEYEAWAEHPEAVSSLVRSGSAAAG